MSLEVLRVCAGRLPHFPALEEMGEEVSGLQSIRAGNRCEWRSVQRQQIRKQLTLCN